MAHDVTTSLRQLDRYRWEIPRQGAMRVPGLVYADEAMLGQIGTDQALQQVANVATLPGIVGRSLAMPDVHWGYGFPVGGVAAMRIDEGVISPGGVGYDISCGVRLLRTDLGEADVRPRLDALLDALLRAVPAGVGSKGRVRVSVAELDEALGRGAAWAVERGLGWAADLETCESGGRLPHADPGAVSAEAKRRGKDELGSLGSGNHFLEVQVVDEVLDEGAAGALGLARGRVAVFVHCGSRGLGHQVCTDYLKVCDRAHARYGIELVDRQLACVPFTSAEGRRYFGAMAAAANFAWANRQVITHQAREAFASAFGATPDALGMALVYDVSHNIAKVEPYEVEGRTEPVVVHRKGATRAFPPGHPEVPPRYRGVGQPVLIPGDMGRYSFVALGSERAMAESFGSTCHGAGRVASRGAARRMLEGRDVAAELRRRGIAVRAVNRALLAEEASEAYKDVAEVVRVCEGAGLSRAVARLRPIGVVKG